MPTPKIYEEAKRTGVFSWHALFELPWTIQISLIQLLLLLPLCNSV